MIKLYQLPNCPFCAIVREKLEELEVKYEVINIDPNDRPPAVTKLGGTVPVIDDDGTVMNESADIIQYLEKKYGKK